MQNIIEKLKSINSRDRKVFIILGIILVLILVFKFAPTHKTSNKESVKAEEPEITAIKGTQVLGDQIEQYKKLIERVGPGEAQDDLYRSGLPFTGETHLLNHTVGDYLYKNFGDAGLVQCRDYFLSSCYHGFLLHAIADGGMKEITKIFEYCKAEGDAVASQCAHAMGHGFLANVGYKNLTKALKTCDEATTTIQGFPSFNCYDGVFMENIWAVHDGEPSPDRWVKPSDVMYPCDDSRISPKYLQGCWSNQPSLVYQFYQGDVKKIADNLCAKVADVNYQQMCFDGLARQIHPLTAGSAATTLNLCSLMPSEKWNNFCVSVNAGASYSVGDRSVPFQICASAQESGKEECYDRVFGMMSAYKKPYENLHDLCSKVTDQAWQNKCTNMY